MSGTKVTDGWWVVLVAVVVVMVTFPLHLENLCMILALDYLQKRFIQNDLFLKDSR